MAFRPAKREPAPPGDIIRGLVAFREQSRTFEIFTRIGEDNYEIHADRILTHKQFTDWIWQLQPKGWMSGQHFADFFECLSEFIYRQWGQNPQEFYEVISAINSDPDSV
jgi:hypothetical protein